MKLYLKQKVFSWSKRFYVKDENGSDCYHVQGEVLTWKRKIRVYDMTNHEVAYIEKRIWTWLPRYLIEVDDQPVVEIVKEFTFLRPSYRIEGSNWRIEGDFLAHNYSLFDEEKIVMTLTKEWFTWGSSYQLDIVDAKDALLCLGIAIVVDCVTADEAAANNASQ